SEAVSMPKYPLRVERAALRVKAREETRIALWLVIIYLAFLIVLYILNQWPWDSNFFTMMAWGLTLFLIVFWPVITVLIVAKEIIAMLHEWTRIRRIEIARDQAESKEVIARVERAFEHSQKSLGGEVMTARNWRIAIEEDQQAMRRTF